MMRIGFIALLLLFEGFQDRARSVEQRIFDAVNGARTARGIPLLRWSNRIAEQARHHSRRMLERRFMSHSDPQFGGPGNRLSLAGIAWRTCGENIYEQFGDQDPVRSAVQSWLQSAGHRRNMLNAAYTDTGIGVAIGRNGEYLITQMFVAF
jgi:uncharacterized protein YkwD